MFIWHQLATRYDGLAWLMALIGLILIPYLEFSTMKRGGLPVYSLIYFLLPLYLVFHVWSTRRKQKKLLAPAGKTDLPLTDFIRFTDTVVEAGTRGRPYITWEVNLLRTFELATRTIDLDVTAQIVRLRLSAMTKDEVDAVRRWLVTHVPRAAKCDNCDYDLRGSHAIDCPECGFAVQGVRKLCLDRR